MQNSLKQLYRVFLIVGSVGLLVPQKTQAEINKEIILGTAAVGALCAGIGYGIKSLWLNQSVESVLEKSHTCLEQADEAYYFDIMNFHQNINRQHMNGQDINLKEPSANLLHSMTTIDEVMLESIAENIRSSEQTVESYVATMTKVLHELKCCEEQLKAHHDALEKQLDKSDDLPAQIEAALFNSFNYSDATTRRQLVADNWEIFGKMVALEKTMKMLSKIEEILPDLSVYCAYIATHRAYFDLYEHDALLNTKYEKEINTALLTQYKYSDLFNCIGTSFLKRVFYFSNYKRHLIADVKKLHKLLRKANLYPVLYKNGILLKQCLVRIDLALGGECGPYGFLEGEAAI